MPADSHFDVIIIGAGLSGIAAAYHLQEKCPSRRFTIIEARDRLGGTWDLFRYPGVRSDSDMYTLGFPFRPWKQARAIADGGDIRSYLEDTAAEFGIHRHIQFGQRVVASRWSSDQSMWTLEIRDQATDEVRHITCGFLFACSGYYRYDRGYTPEFEGVERFAGEVVHPQFWPPDLNYDGKRVVIIGSGATAVTLVPAMAEAAEHVVMLQRSPSYIFSVPTHAAQEDWIRKALPAPLAHRAIRWRRIVMATLFVQMSLRFPARAKRWMIDLVAKALGPDADISDFTPRYDPWKQRVCLVPDGDLFDVIKSGQASVVTDNIECFTETGIRLRSGREIDADIIVTATGLEAALMAGNTIEVDGRQVELSEHYAYRAMMLSGVPNMAFAAGYTRGGSWTLKVDLVCDYVCRLLNDMERRGYTQCVATVDASMEEGRLVDFDSGYIERALAHLPRAGTRHPWRVFENYFLDWATLGFARLHDGVLKFS